MKNLKESEPNLEVTKKIKKKKKKINETREDIVLGPEELNFQNVLVKKK